VYTASSPGRAAKNGRALQSLAVALLLAPAFCCAACAAEVPPRVEPYRLVRVTLAPDERAFVLGEGFIPVEIETTGSGLVFTGPPGRYAILVFSPTSQQQLFTHICASAPTPPGPNPPPPTPPNPPPTPPAPPNPVVENAYGVGQPAYDAARSLNLPDECRKLSTAFSEAASAIHTGQLPADVKATLDATLDSLSPAWRAEWLPPVSAAVTAAQSQYGTALIHRKSIYLEVSLALARAGQ
jgi:hypothetical protein